MAPCRRVNGVSVSTAPSASPNSCEVLGIKPWKRWQIDPFLRPRYARVHYAHATEQALAGLRVGDDLVVWAARESPGLAAAVKERGCRLVRIEDGFLRSVGLGSNHIGGYSLVIDALGIYFDPRQPSSLEALLEQREFGPDLLVRAARLRQSLLRHGLTKYNAGDATTTLSLGAAPGQRCVLVPGQVEDDVSVRHGSPQVRSNIELLAAVRRAEPDAWIVYKPHPDVEAGTRKGKVADEDGLRHADRVVRDVSVAALFPQINAVHTMTSLVGFEALLRGVEVQTWGLPFYAGWGLSTDRCQSVRRTRQRSLDELVAAVLILYPAYVDPESGQACEVETVVDWLALQKPADPAAQRSQVLRILRLLRGLLRTGRSALARH